MMHLTSEQNNNSFKPLTKKTSQEVIAEYQQGKRRFQYLDLSGESFIGCNLSDADFTGCKLIKTRFNGAKLSRAKFCRVNADNQSSQEGYTKFFLLLILAASIVVLLVTALIDSRQNELDLIINYGADFAALAVLVPVGYFVHLCRKGASIALSYWGAGLFTFVLKTLNEPLTSLLSEVLFWVVMVATLLPAAYDLWSNFLTNSNKTNLNRRLQKNTRNLLKEVILILLSILVFVFVLLALLHFLPFSGFLLLLFRTDQESLTKFLLYFSSFTFNIPVIFSPFLALASYSALFDRSVPLFGADVRETYGKATRSLMDLGLLVFIFIIAYSTNRRYLEIVFSVVGILPLFILLGAILLLCLISPRILEQQEQSGVLFVVRIFNALAWLVWVIAPCFIWAYLFRSAWTESYFNAYISEAASVEKWIRFIGILILLAFSVLLTWNFSTFSSESHPTKKLTNRLGYWTLLIPTFILLILIIVRDIFLTSKELGPLLLSTLFLLIFLLLSSPPRIFKDFFSKMKDKLRSKRVVSNTQNNSQTSSQFVNKLRESNSQFYYWFVFLFIVFSILISHISSIVSIFISLSLIDFLVDWLEYGYADYPYWYEVLLVDNIYRLGHFLLYIFPVFPLALGLLLFAEEIILDPSESQSLTSSAPLASNKQRINPQYAAFHNLAVSYKCLNSTIFSQANLTEADFSGANLAGVNFRGAKLKRVCWSGTKGLERCAVGNTYLKYPKVRNWVTAAKCVISDSNQTNS